MAKLNNCVYNKIKLLHELSSILWFIERHANIDEAHGGSKECLAMLGELERDLEKYVDRIKAVVCK
jgi:hypothetical protein